MYEIFAKIERLSLIMGTALVSTFYIVVHYLPHMSHMHVGAAAAALIMNLILRLRRMSRRARKWMCTIMVLIAGVTSIAALYVPIQHLHTAATIGALITNLALVWN